MYINRKFFYVSLFYLKIYIKKKKVNKKNFFFFLSKKIPLQILTEVQLLENLEIREFKTPNTDEINTKNDDYWIIMYDLIITILDIESIIKKTICDSRFNQTNELWLESMEIALKIFNNNNFFKVFIFLLLIIKKKLKLN